MSQLLCNKAFKLNEMPKDAWELIEKAIQEDALRKYILIVPTGKSVRHFQLDTIRKYFDAHRKPAEKLHIYTLQHFVQHCFGFINNRHSYRVISDAYRLAMFEEAAEKATLNFFVKKDKSLSPAVLQRLANIIFGLKEDGITVDNLKEDIMRAETLADQDVELPKLQDIASLYEGYQDLLNGKYLDYPELLNLMSGRLAPSAATSAFDELFKSDVDKKSVDKLAVDEILPPDTVILLYGFSEFKLPELKFLSYFAQSKIPFAVNIDYSVINGPLFGNLEETIENLAKQGLMLYSLEESAVRKSVNENFRNMTRSTYLRRWLFNTERNIINKSFTNIIKIIAAEDRRDEVRSIAKLVRYLHLKQDVALHDICISMRNSDKYSNLFRDTLAHYKIPANIADRFPLAKSPVVIAILSVFDIIIRGYKREDVHRALKSPYLKFENSSPNGIVTQIDAANLYDTALKLRIVGTNQRRGAKVWFRRIESGIKSVEINIEYLKKNKKADLTDIERNERILSAYKKAYNDFKALADALPIENKHYTPQEFSGIIKNDIIRKFAVKELILDFYNKIKDNIESYPYSDRVFLLEKAEKDTRAYAALIRIVDEMTFLLNDRHPDIKLKLEDYVQKLKTSITGARYTTREKQKYGVTVTAIEQTRNIPYKVMILCGALDGEFPIAYKPEKFLGKELPDTEQRFIRTERLQFYQFISNSPNDLDAGNKQIFITYPLINDTEELVRSPFIDALLKITTLENDRKIYNLMEIRKALSLNEHEKPEYGQRSDIEWLTAIANETEAVRLQGENLYKVFAKGGGEIENIFEEALKNYINISNTTDFIRKYIKDQMQRIDYKPVFDRDYFESQNVDELELLKNRDYSISDLETYAKCPFQYFGTKLLGLSKLEEPELTLSSMEKGNLLHLILHRFYTIIQQRQLGEKQTEVIAQSAIPDLPKLAPVRLDTTKKDDYLSLLYAIAKEEMNRVRFEHPLFDIQEEEFLGNSYQSGLLEQWLNSEMERIGKGWDYLPVLFEFGFGSTTGSHFKDNNINIHINDKFKISGKIDRIEVKTDEENNETYFIIADYKTTLGNNIPQNKEIRDGISFQMPLYLYAASEILNKYYDFPVQPSGAVYYAIKPRYDKAKKQFQVNSFVLLNKDSSLASNLGINTKTQTVENMNSLLNELEKSKKYAEDEFNNILAGNFRAEPNKSQTCEYCILPHVCRIGELKPSLIAEEA